MKIIACVPVVNRPDLLQQALLSLLPATKAGELRYVITLDNSGIGLARWAITDPTSPARGTLIAAEFEGRLRVVEPPTPLNFALSQNAIQELLRQSGADAVLFAHSDMAATPEAVARVLAAARRDCIVFSHYDVLAAFGADVIARVGPWDPAIPWYYADNDWYRRVRLAGVEVVEVGGEGVVHQNDASSTIKSDWRLALATNQQTLIARAVYAEKWGGEPGSERYAIPYDGARLIPPVEWLMTSPLYDQLAGSYHTNEGTLFEQEPRARWAQLRALAWAFEQAGRPREVLETGTAKGFFGYLLSWLATRPTSLFTFDDDPRSRKAVELLNAGQRTVKASFTLGDSTVTIPAADLRGIGLAWIDGGHDEPTAFHDLTACLRANIPWVLVDDTEMPEVGRAVEQALAAHPRYTRIDHPWQADDQRIISTLVRKDA